MREIKFRAWYDNKMWYLAKLDLWGDPDQTTCDLAPYLPKYEELYDICLSDVILMQSTGLKDKNGIEIYEGDIVRSNWYDYDNNAYKKKGEVIFVGAQSVIAYDSKFVLETGEIEYDAHSLSYAENPEVIGNIYENSELLDKNL